jgi:16S rRNA (adenine1518-N6/adenine1519-N6)-dimethyltransferase
MPAKPRLGQNFLNDAQAIERIAASLGDLSGRTVLEIGPGAGAITSALVARAARVIAVELDSGLAGHLRARFPADRVTVHQQDVLTFDFSTAAAEAGHPLPVFGNLPYYITSQIVLKLAASAAALDRAVLMVQREVADRITADPQSRDYGLLSVTSSLCRLRHFRRRPMYIPRSFAGALLRDSPNSEWRNERLSPSSARCLRRNGRHWPTTCAPRAYQSIESPQH